MKQYVEQALEMLRRGGTLLYPTDTIWGIGCDATNEAAVERIYQIKERDRSKSMLILCSDEAMLREYAVAPTEESIQTALHPDRPTTVIFSAKNLPHNMLAADGTIGIRIPRMEFCQELLMAFGKPIVSTSANLSGEPSPKCFGEISQELRNRVDHIVEDRPEYNRETQGSRIVKLTPEGEIIIIRP